MSTVIDGSLGITYPDSSNQPAASSPYTLKNRIINGSMQIDQRNAGASVTPTSDGTYVLDRWECALSQASKYSVQQQTSVVPTGYTYATKITSLSSYSLSASDYFIYTQKIEGFNIADLAWGTANAKTVTLSFQVYSSLTGTFGGAIHNSAANRSYPFSYTISSANTWTTISITIPGDTSGTWLTTNGIGMWVRFGLGVGSTYSATAGSWSSNLYVSATGATSVVGTNGATWYITGVQLEIGTSATPFERRLYNQELANCQRYFCLLAGGGACGVAELSNRVSLTYQYPVPMRASPTGTLDATKGTLNQPQGGPNVVTTMNNFFFGTATSETGGWIVLDTSTSPFTAGRVIINAGTTGMIKFSAEL